MGSFATGLPAAVQNNRRRDVNRCYSFSVRPQPPRFASVHPLHALVSMRMPHDRYAISFRRRRTTWQQAPYPQLVITSLLLALQFVLRRYDHTCLVSAIDHRFHTLCVHARASRRPRVPVGDGVALACMVFRCMIAPCVQHVVDRLWLIAPTVVCRFSRLEWSPGLVGIVLMREPLRCFVIVCWALAQCRLWSLCTGHHGRCSFEFAFSSYFLGLYDARVQGGRTNSCTVSKQGR